MGKVEIGLELDEGEHGPPIDLSLCYLLLTTLQETASENQGEGGKNLYFEARNGYRQVIYAFFVNIGLGD